MPTKEDLIKCFQDTINIINTNDVLLNSTKDAMHRTSLIISNDNSIISDNNMEVSISVDENSTFNTAEKYVKQCQKTAVLNFASSVNSGGGVARGAMAQEECLCRSSNLLPCLKQNHLMKNYYMPHRIANDPMYSHKVIYTENITVFKTDDALPKLMHSNEWFNVDVITCAAPNLRNIECVDENELFNVLCSRVDMILNAALKHNIDTVILGAWGCGAFENPSELVAKAFKQVIDEKYRCAFKNIVFAVKKSSNNNFDVFKSIFDVAPKIQKCDNDKHSFVVKEELTGDDSNLKDKEKTTNQQKSKFCHKCGAQLKLNDKFCMKCGAKAIDAAANQLKEESDKEDGTPIYDVPEIIDNRYKLVRQTGKGASAIVYLAQDMKLNRVCAVKIVKKNTYSNKMAAQESLEEVNKMKLLAHISIPQLYDIYDDDDRLCIVMEFIDGQNLNEIIKAQKNPFDEYTVISWAKQLCRVLFYLHTLKPPRIFRDLKPANIILQPNGIIKLIDFGTMKNYDESCTEDTVNLGTKGYAAPEQFGGRGQTDARTDIYGLGMTMYHLITGVNPSLPPFEFKPPGYYRKDISVGLERIIMKCIEIERENRYQSAMDLLNDLEKIK